MDVPSVQQESAKVLSPGSTLWAAAPTAAARASPRHAAIMVEPEPLIQNAEAPAPRQAARQRSVSYTHLTLPTIRLV